MRVRGFTESDQRCQGLTLHVDRSSFSKSENPYFDVSNRRQVFITISSLVACVMENPLRVLGMTRRRRIFARCFHSFIVQKKKQNGLITSAFLVSVDSLVD